jgi:hypothetical protein
VYPLEPKHEAWLQPCRNLIVKIGQNLGWPLVTCVLTRNFVLLLTIQASSTADDADSESGSDIAVVDREVTMAGVVLLQVVLADYRSGHS